MKFQVQEKEKSMEVHNFNHKIDADDGTETYAGGMPQIGSQMFESVLPTIRESMAVDTLGFPAPDEIMSYGGESQTRTEDFRPELQSSVRNEVRDAHGNLSSYSIGPEDNSTEVRVFYANPSSDRPVISRLQLVRPNNGERIVYEREKSDPNDPDSPYAYSESRDGVKGDLRFGGLSVDRDGRINLYFDRARTKLAISFNPQSGEEEYPRKN